MCIRWVSFSLIDKKFFNIYGIVMDIIKIRKRSKERDLEYRSYEENEML